jgi:hypothetical protein
MQRLIAIICTVPEHGPALGPDWGKTRVRADLQAEYRGSTSLQTFRSNYNSIQLITQQTNINIADTLFSLKLPKI